MMMMMTVMMTVMKMRWGDMRRGADGCIGVPYERRWLERERDVAVRVEATFVNVCLHIYYKPHHKNRVIRTTSLLTSR